MNLWDPLTRVESRPDLLRCWHEGGYRPWSFGEWLGRSYELAAGLRAAGVRPGDRVGCLLTNTPDTCAALIAVWLAGGCVVSAPLIARGMRPEQYKAQLERIIETAEPTALFVDANVSRLLDALSLRVRTLAFHEASRAGSFEPTLPDIDEPVFVQFTSGSTSEPSGCILTARAIARQLELLETALEIDPERDTGVVWLPLSHDMGLFGCLLLAYWTGMRLVLGTPSRFLADPISWLDDCAEFAGTISAMPPFGLDLVARHAKRCGPLRHPIRRLVVGGEHIDDNVLRRASGALGDDRLPFHACVPAYGLAEAVLAVTMAPLNIAPRTASVAGYSFGPADSRCLETVSCGRPLGDGHVQIDGGGLYGEIIAKPASLAQGYLGNPGLTGCKFTPQGLRTGDVGFIDGGDLFVVGRLDDMMSVGGRNVFGRDIELALRPMRSLRRGAVAAVEVKEDGHRRLIILSELVDSAPDPAVIAEEISHRTRSALGVKIDECVFLPHGALPKTPSGKIQRSRCREIASDARTAARWLRVRP